MFVWDAFHSQMFDVYTFLQNYSCNTYISDITCLLSYIISQTSFCKEFTLTRIVIPFIT